MSKFVRTAAMIAGAAALIATGVGAVAGTSLAIGSIGTVGSIASTASIVSAGLGAAAALTAERPSQQRQGLQLSFKIDPGAPIPIVVGRTATAGTVVHRSTYGTDSHYQTYFSVLSGAGPIDAVEGFLADRELVTFGGTAATGYYANWMWQDRQTGATPEGDALGHGIVTPPFGSIPGFVPGWGPNYLLSGYGAVSWSMLFDTKSRRYANGEPTPLWIVRGVRAYDPRKDSTYPGGSGPHRWADPSNRAAHQAARATWTFTKSPALIGLMWRLGFWHCDESNPASVYQRVAGIGARLDQIDLPSIVEAANVQEANGWEIGGELDTAADKWETLKLIEQAGGAEPIPRGALMGSLVHAPRVPIGRITTKDLGSAAQFEAPRMRPRRERLNQYRPRFRSEAHGWEMTDADLVSFPDLVAADGRERTGAGDFALVQDAQQVTELAGYEIWSGREIQPLELSLKLDFVGARIGDCYTIHVPELALIEQDAIVRGKSVEPSTLEPTLTFRGETPAKHAMIFALTGTTPPAPVITPPSPGLTAPLASDWAIEGATLSANGVSIPAVVVTGGVGNSTADSVAFELRPFVEGQGADAGWSAASIDPAQTTRKEFGAVVPGRDYEASVRYRSRGITSDRLILGPVTAGQLAIKAVDQLLIANSFPVGISITGADAGGSATIAINGHSRSYQDRTVAIAAGTLTGLDNGQTYFLFYDDAARAGGAVTFQTTTDYASAFTSAEHPARHYVGACLTPAPGGGSSEGGGGSPPGGGGYSPQNPIP